MPHNRKNYRRNKAIRKRKEREDERSFGFKNCYGNTDLTHYNAERIIDNHYTYDDVRYK